MSPQAYTGQDRLRHSLPHIRARVVLRTCAVGGPVGGRSRRRRRHEPYPLLPLACRRATALHPGPRPAGCLRLAELARVAAQHMQNRRLGTTNVGVLRGKKQPVGRDRSLPTARPHLRPDTAAPTRTPYPVGDVGARHARPHPGRIGRRRSSIGPRPSPAHAALGMEFGAAQRRRSIRGCQPAGVCGPNTSSKNSFWSKPACHCRCHCT